MKKIGVIAAMLLLVSVPFASCKKKEQPPVPPPMQEGSPGPAGSPHGEMGGGPEKKVIVPPDVQSAWKSVKVEVEFREKKTKKTFSIPLNSEYKVPDSDLTIKVGDFLPHFAMTADSITSNSNNLENPAARVEVSEKGSTVFKGWLFSKFPDVHPFQHDKYGLKLLEGEKK